MSTVGAGKELFAEICGRDLEGIVAKRKTGLYRDDRPDWLKVKNRTYSQAEGGATRPFESHEKALDFPTKN